VNRSELRTWALRGAERRLAEIAEETRAIYAAFPELRGAPSGQPANPYTPGVRRAVAGVRPAVEGAVTRRRPKMSAEARKRIAEAQRKRWAEWKAQQPKTEQGGGASPQSGPRGRSKKKK
jgi:hypothetical protein